MSYLYGINAATGARLRLPPFDYSRDGTIDSEDYLTGQIPPSGIQVSVPGGIPLTPDGLICANDGDCIEFMLPPEKQGRTSWQELPATP